MASILTKWGYLHNNMVFCYKVLSFFIIHQDLSFGGFALKIEFVVFVYELFNYLFMKLFFLLLGYVIMKLLFLLLGYVIIIIITTTSNLQPNTPTANQLPGQLVSTEIRTMHKNKF